MSNRVSGYLESVGGVADVAEEQDYGPFESRVSVANPSLRVHRGRLCLETYAHRCTKTYRFAVSEWPVRCNDIELRVNKCRPDGTTIDRRDIYPYDVCRVRSYRAGRDEYGRGEVSTEVDLDYYSYRSLANFSIVIAETYYKRVSLSTRRYVAYHLEAWKPGEGLIAFDVPVAKFNSLRWLRECLPPTWQFEQKYAVGSREYNVVIPVHKPLTNKLIVEHIINISNDIKEVQV